MRIVLTGSAGMLGYAFLSLNTKHEILKIDKKLGYDIVDFDLMNKIISDFKPEVIIHGGAYTDVPGNERNPDIAYKINAIGTRNIAVIAEKNNSKIVYISTDYVFDGKKGNPYIEYDSTNPLSIYGKSKLAGEKYVETLSSKYFICRTSWLYGDNGNNFVDKIIKVANGRDVVNVVADEIGTPTFTFDLAEYVYAIIKTDYYGIYHMSSNGSTSWYEFTKKIYNILGIKVKVEPISSEEYGDIVIRPKYSVLRNYNLELTIGDRFPKWDESLKNYLERVYL